MQFKALKVFCDVVQQKSFSKAADDNNISQSGASQLVQQLEEHLGVQLIDRSKRPFILTAEGEIYHNGVRELVQRYFVLEDKVRTMHQEVIGRVRVASIYSVGLHLMSSFITDFYREYPKANVHLEYLHPDRVLESVEADVADIGLVSYPKSSRTIDAIAWREEPMVLVCNPQHPLANENSIPITRLKDAEMVGFDEDLMICREINRVLSRHNIPVHIKLAFDNVETIKRAVEVGIGVSLLPKPTVQREVEAGSLRTVEIENNELIRPLGIIHRRGKELSATAERFIELLRRVPETKPAAGVASASSLVAAATVDSDPNSERRNGKTPVAVSQSSPA